MIRRRKMRGEERRERKGVVPMKSTSPAVPEMGLRREEEATGVREPDKMAT